MRRYNVKGRRATVRKKKDKKRRPREPSFEKETRSKKTSPASPKKTKSTKKRSAASAKKKGATSAKKKTAASASAKKKTAASAKKKAAASAKKKAATPAKKKAATPAKKAPSRKVRRPSTAILGVATRVQNKLEKLSRGRTSAEISTYESVRESYRRALEKIGLSPRQISAKLGWSTRRAKRASALRGVAERARNRLEKHPKPRTKKQIASFQRAKESYRASLEKLGLPPARVRALVGASTRARRTVYASLSDVRRIALGGLELDARDRDHWTELRAHVGERSKAFRRYVEAAEEMDIDVDTAIDLWFSPEGE